MNIVIEDDTIESVDSLAAVKETDSVDRISLIGLSLMLFWSISVYLFDVGTDVMLAIVYYQAGDRVDSLFTLVLILFPTILTSLLCYAYHEKIIFNPTNSSSKITEETGLLETPEKENADRKKSGKSFIFRLICNISLLGPILW